MYKTDKPNTVFLGDVHGDWKCIKEFCRNYQDFLIIQIGDFGLGFYHPKKDASNLRKLNDILHESHNEMIAIRGNHDNPSYFNGKWIEEEIHLARDYDIVETMDCGVVQMIGGAVSVDRIDRNPGRTWWSNEGVNFYPEAVISCDILVTHAHPMSSPIEKAEANPMVASYIERETNHRGSDLKKELLEESLRIQELSELSMSKCHIFGHLHIDQTYMVNDRRYYCVGIDTFKEVRI